MISAAPTTQLLPALEKDAQGVWQVRGFQEARTLMNATVTQAGFGTEQMMEQRRYITPPIPALDGEEHRERRTQIAKFFTPSAVTKQYRALIEGYADAIAAKFPPNTDIDFKNFSTEMASAVVRDIVGMTNSIRPGLEKRFLYVASNHDVGKPSLAPKELLKLASGLGTILALWLLDVRPAVQERRKNPKHDLISHMISQKRNAATIVVECIAYGLAGVLTTREYMCSALELCLRHPEYRTLMLEGDDESRTRFLYEVLRLNPVTSHLTRRAADDITVTSDGQTLTIKKGELMVFNIFEIDTDPRTLGEDALELNPTRSYESRIMWSMLAFGYGVHRCPGEALAIMETDILLRKLLPLDIQVVKYPKRGFNDPSKTNELYDFIIRRNA